MLLIPIQVFSQEYLYLLPEDKSQTCSHLKSFKHHDELMLADDVVRRPYDILTMDLYMDWTNPLSSELENPEDYYYTGTSKMKIRIDSANTERIVFDAVSMAFSKISINGIDISDNVTYDGDFLDLPISAEQGDTINVQIDYEYRGNGRRGANIYKEGHPVSAGSGDVYKRIIYTMSQPTDARAWMPCNDKPYEKQVASIAVKVTPENVVASNGLLDSTQTDENGNITFFWSDDKPVPSYLMVANASEYEVWEEKVARPSNPQDSIVLKYYTWSIDRSDSLNDYGYNANFAFYIMPEMMTIFNEQYTDYPWKQYGTVAVHPFRYGGMEHQTMETINRAWLRWSDLGLAHELAHMWTGDMVTCASWADIWMNEGGATWGEALWREHWQGKHDYFDQLLGDRANYLGRGGLSSPPIWGFNEQTVFSRTELVYSKAAWVYHHLRNNFGDEQFFSLMRKYFNEFYFKSISSNDFKEFLKREMDSSKVDMDVFFDQWVYGAGHPVFDINANANWRNDKYEIQLDLTQVQTQITNNNKVSEVFITPIQIKFYPVNDTNVITREFYIDELNERFTENFDVEISKIEYETNYTLGEENNVSLSVEDISSSINVYPNPAQRSNNISVNIQDNLPLRIELVNSNGSLIKNYQNISNSLILNTSSLSAGIYFIKLIYDDDTIVKKIIII